MPPSSAAVDDGAMDLRKSGLALSGQRIYIQETLRRWLNIVNLEVDGESPSSGCVRIEGPHEAMGSKGDQELIIEGLGSRSRSPYYPLNMVHNTEPRISAIAMLLKSILPWVSIYDDADQPIRPDGFSLKDLRHWLVPLRPGDTEPIEHYLAAGVCNVNCEFCYEHGAPPEMQTPRGRVAPSELRTRLKYYDDEGGQVLFDMTHQYYDAFSHPSCMDTLETMRERSNGSFDLITNGRTLTPETIGRLAHLVPLRLTISLNSSDTRKRALVMRDRTPMVAAESLPLLQERNIPFGIVVVPWPPELDADDLEETIRFVEPFKPMFVSVSLPGYTRYFPDPPAVLDDEYHLSILRRIRSLRRVVKTPLLVQPRLAEASWFNENHDIPFVLGSMPGSSADRAELRYGDQIVAINGIAASYAYDAQRFLELLEIRGIRNAEITVRRDGVCHSTTLLATVSEFECGRGFGVVVAQGVRGSVWRDLNRLLEEGGNTWILSSRWMLTSVERFLNGRRPRTRPDVRVIGVENRYFGGNISLGDLLVVEDFCETIESSIERHGRPDRVIIPGSAFSAWGRDLRGVSINSLRRRAGVPIDVLENNRILV